jgi:hypothetical protein
MHVLDPVGRHPVASYVVLACGLSWASWPPGQGRGMIAAPPAGLEGVVADTRTHR